MSRDKQYQKLLNSKQWQRVKKFVWERAGGLCERCRREGIAAGVLPDGYITPGVDCHHIRPVEGAKSLYGLDGMISRCFDTRNIELLCVPCHIKTHTELKSHTKEQVSANKHRARQRFLEANDPNYKPQDNG